MLLLVLRSASFVHILYLDFIKPDPLTRQNGRFFKSLNLLGLAVLLARKALDILLASLRGQAVSGGLGRRSEESSLLRMVEVGASLIWRRFSRIKGELREDLSSSGAIGSLFPIAAPRS